jgi:ParB-like chromosome segregation protein Spo0J
VRSDGGGNLCLVAGHRRLAAARAAKLERVPVLVTAGGEDPLVDAITENLQREGLRPWRRPGRSSACNNGLA